MVWLVLLIILWAFPAQATTYYVATTGNDSNDGSSGSPWANPQKCAGSPVAAGDTCIVGNGTYTDTDSNGVVIYVSGSSPSGTAGNPITIQSANPGGATITMPSLNAGNSGFYITQPYWVIDGFTVTGGTDNGLSTSYNAIVFTSGATGGVAKNNIVHDIARTVCSDSVFGYDAFLVDGTTGVTLESNTVYTVGRLRDGESGCSTVRYQNDHGFYIKGATDLIVRRNVCYDTNRGWCVHVYGATTTNLKVYHNTFADKSPTGSPIGHIILASTVTTADIVNNISSDPEAGVVYYAGGLTASGVTIHYTLTTHASINANSPPAGITTSNNTTSTTPGFTNAGARDYTLTSSAAARDVGTTSGVPSVTDGLPDIGYYEYEGDTTPPAVPTGVTITKVVRPWR